MIKTLALICPGVIKSIGFGATLNRKILCLFTLIFFVLRLSAQYHLKPEPQIGGTHYYTEGLKGNIKSVRVFSYFASGNEKTGLLRMRSIRYHPSGLVQTDTFFDTDDIWKIESFQYDAANQPEKKFEDDRQSGNVEVTFYQNARPKRVDVLREDGSSYTSMEYVYRDREIWDIFKNETGATDYCQKRKFDAHGNETHFSEDADMDTITDFHLITQTVYDTAGRLIERYDISHDKVEGKEFYIYDDNNRVVDMKFYFKSAIEPTIHKIFEYNEQGDVSLWKWRETGVVTFSNTYTNKYEYDRHGNWTKCFTTLNGSPSRTIARVISYY
jgi:hypothetical protein